MRRLQRLIAQRISENRLLVAMWLVLLIAQPRVPVEHILARDDLAMWLILTLCCCVYLQGRQLGPGPHPMLTPRKRLDGRMLRSIARTAAPVVLLAWYDTGAQIGLRMLEEVGLSGITPISVLGTTGHGPAQLISLLAASITGSIIVGVAMAIGGRHGETAWSPAGRPQGCLWLFGAPALLGLVIFLGMISPLDPGLALDLVSLPIGRWVGLSGLLGLAFLTVGLLDGRSRHLRQRLSAGRRDGSKYKQDLFPYLLAIGGPGGGLFILFVLYELFGGLDFNQAYVGALHVAVWASVIWSRPDPLARACILHEVVPTGGGDPKVKDRALGFDQPPEGALRFSPLRIKRTRVVHPWLVPVRGSRIADLDDPIMPLWDRRPPFLSHHILGAAAFEPDPLTRGTQSSVITVRIRASEDDDTVQVKSEGGGGTKRLVVLRSYPRVGAPRRMRLATYRWDTSIPEESIQVLDGRTEVATLVDGDVLVVSSEGVARAYEIEIGQPLYERSQVEAFRPPQLEDYVKAG